MIVSLRLLLATLALIALTTMLVLSDGFYSESALFCALATLGLALAACLGPDRKWQIDQDLASPLLVAAALFLVLEYGVRRLFFEEETIFLEAPVALGALAAGVVTIRGQLRRAPFSVGLLAMVALLFSGQAVFSTQLYYAEDLPAVALMNGAAVAGFLVIVTLVADRRIARPRQGFRTRLVLLFVTGAMVRASAVAASPNPVIDTYIWLRDAPGHLLEGQNPYTAEYPNVYVSNRAYEVRVIIPGPDWQRLPAYPPLPILLGLPFRAVGLDVRYANVVCDLLAALVLLGAGWTRGSPVVGALAAGAYLHLPRAPFMMEQDWYEPMLAATLGGGLLLVERGRRLGYLLLGLGLTGKQFGPALLPPLWKAMNRKWPWLLLGIGLAVVAVLGPFFLWNPQAFLDVVLLQHMQRPPQPEGITFFSGVWDLFQVALPKPLLWGTAVVLIGLITWRTPSAGTASALWMGTALLVFVLCHSQGFFNYFYLCQYLLLLGIASKRSQESEVGSQAGVRGLLTPD